MTAGTCARVCAPFDSLSIRCQCCAWRATRVSQMSLSLASARTREMRVRVDVGETRLGEIDREICISSCCGSIAFLYIYVCVCLKCSACVSCGVWRVGCGAARPARRGAHAWAVAVGRRVRAVLSPRSRSVDAWSSLFGERDFSWRMAMRSTDQVALRECYAVTIPDLT